MPGNEVPNNLHIFFLQENLSQNQQQSQAQAQGENWPILNSNPWFCNRRQNEAIPNSNLKEHSIESDYVRGNVWQSSRITIGTDIAQLNLRPEFVKTQPRNQQLSSNAFMYSQGVQTRPNQVEFLGEDSVSVRQKLMSRSLPILETQLGNALSTVQARKKFRKIGYDFLGVQQQLMRNQEPGAPQPWLRQQMGLNDMQLWQQQVMHKQLQELQRQQQLQQLDQQARQQHSLSQLSGVAKQSSDQLPALGNGAPMHDATNYMWSREHDGGDSKIPSTSQMYMVGNMNWIQRSGPTSAQAFPNGLMLPHDQGQALCSMGFAPQQFDQSLYGAPVGGARGNLSRYSHVQGISHDSADISTKFGGNQVEKQVIQPIAINSFQVAQSPVFPDQLCTQDGSPVSKQGFQEKNLFGHDPIQTLPNGSVLGNFQQVNQFPRNVQVQEFLGRQEGDGWVGNLQEKAVSEVVPSQGSVSLDPTEEKILFNSDDGIWGASFGRTCGMSEGGDQLEGTDHLNALASVQSGSWSALMQSAVAEASGDTGLRDEWSGLSLQKSELSTGNHPTSLGGSGKQPTAWVDNNLQTASSLASRPFPLFDDANMSPGRHRVSDFQQSNVKYTFGEIQRVMTNASHESFQRLPKEVSKPLIEGSHQVQMPIPFEKTSEGAWGRQIHEQSHRSADSADMELNVLNIQGSLVHPQSMSSYNTSSQSFHKTNSWNINESLSPNGDGTVGTSDIENRAQSSDNKRAMPMERDHDGGMWKVDFNLSFPNSSGRLEQVKSGTGSPQVHNETALRDSSTSKINQEMNHHVLHSDHINYGKHTIVGSSEKYDGNENVGIYQYPPSKGPQAQESSLNNSYRGSSETEMHDKKQESCNQKEISDSYSSGHSHPGQHTVTGGGTKENAWLSGSDSRHVVSSDQKSPGQVGRKSSGSHKFQHHPVGNLGVDMEPADSPKHATHSQGVPQPIAQGLKGKEQGYYGQSRFVGHVVPNWATDIAKDHLPDLLRNAKGAEEVPSRITNFGGHDSTMSASFHGSGSFYGSNRTVHPSQNMLELLHKVDQSREGNTAIHLGSPDHKSSDMPEPVIRSASFAQQQGQSSALQGFGLQLAPPSQCLSNTNHALSLQISPQIVDDVNSGHLGSEVREEGQTRLLTASSVQSLAPSEREHNQSSISGQASIQTSHSTAHRNSLQTVTPGTPHPSNHLEDKCISSASGDHSNLASHFRQAPDPNNGVADRSTPAFLPGSYDMIPPFNLTSQADTCVAVASAQSYSSNTGHAQPMNPNPSFPRGLGQHFSVSQPPVTSGMSQQGSFSSMSHNVWTNVPAKQHLPGGPSHNVPSNFFQSIRPSTSNLEATSWAPQKADDQTVKGGNGPSELVTCSVSSQQIAYGEWQPGKESSMQHMPLERADLAPGTAGASQVQELKAKNLSDAIYIASTSFAVRPDQHDIGRGKDGQERFLVSQSEHVSLSNTDTSDHDAEAFGHSLKPSDALHQNYTQLDQIQAMKGAETDPTMRSGKRLKVSDFSSSSQQAVSRTVQHFAYGYGRTVSDHVDNELSAAAQHSPHALSDSKMLCFSSERNEDVNANASFQLHVQDQHSKDMAIFGRNDPQSSSSHPSTTSTPSLRTNEHPRVNPQVAPSWFERYGTHKNGQIRAMHDELDSSRSTVKVAAQESFFGKASESALHAHAAIVRANTGNASQVGSVWQSSASTLASKEQLSTPHPLPPDDIEENLIVIRSKKRKSLALELLPWHKERSQRLQSISMAELDWARASNRWIEKVEDAELFEDGYSMPQPQRRLILTIQLMQQLLRSIPAAILSGKATSEYESVTYFSAKLALEDACSVMSCSVTDSHEHHSTGNMMSERLKAFGSVGDQFLSKVVEDFIGRVRKLENDLSRLEKIASVLDIKVECQDLERFSIINRFAKFHGRSNASDGIENSSSSGATVQRAYPQRYVTALAMPRNLPEGVLCLSL
ncbi:LOW QUALITY PROTEIN: uncharacterized protein LOC131229192 [Magnolia sinica]|uniref:LOW QUALITY PROTEIN: uncharacterized protein LOC131229192 n=1 Tax=Magnolia sinica TaxID=86752 RepID=UPI00265B2992|nr:LOW QUALITY PROTEIN: uncharacterized protein LOC131229192 [Magnolia sinica]